MIFMKNFQISGIYKHCLFDNITYCSFSRGQLDDNNSLDVPDVEGMLSKEVKILKVSLFYLLQVFVCRILTVFMLEDL